MFPPPSISTRVSPAVQLLNVVILTSMICFVGFKCLLKCLGSTLNIKSIDVPSLEMSQICSAVPQVSVVKSSLVDE